MSDGFAVVFPVLSDGFAVVLPVLSDGFAVVFPVLDAEPLFFVPVSDATSLLSYADEAVLLYLDMYQYESRPLIISSCTFAAAEELETWRRYELASVLSLAERAGSAQ